MFKKCQELLEEIRSKKTQVFFLSFIALSLILKQVESKMIMEILSYYTDSQNLLRLKNLMKYRMKVRLIISDLKKGYFFWGIIKIIRFYKK